MLSLFPDINIKIERLEKIKNNSELWEETEKLNKSLIEED
jgi:hypothetical protein